MGQDLSALSAAIRALSCDTPEAWEAFVRAASGLVWKYALQVSPRRAQGESLFAVVMSGFHANRLALPGKLAAAANFDASAFLVQEMQAHVDEWLLGLFRMRTPEAGEAFVRIFRSDVIAWVRRASPPAALSGVEDRTQDVFTALLSDNGRRISAYSGGGPFRAFLRRVVVNLAADSARRETGRLRPGPASGTSSGRPRPVSLDDEEHAIDPADPGDSPEGQLIAVEEMNRRNEREAALLMLIRNLPSEHRVILQARFLEGRKPREIAALAGRDIKEVYRVLERTLAHLKQALA